MIRYSYCLLLLAGAWILGSCQSVEQLSIDYMLPAEISFPASLKRVAVVNNMPAVPDNKLIISKEDDKKTPEELARLTNYYNGDARLATEALADALAAENYFDEVVIADSALRSKDVTPRESTLTQDEVNELTRTLDVDFLIALENVQLSAVRKLSYLRDWGAYYGTVDVKVYPTIRIYLPFRKGPMVAVTPCDSIFWEEAGSSESLVRSRLIGDEELVRQASEFAGTIPVKQLLPHWKSANRYLFTGGTVSMRDAAVYVREHDWEEAIRLWQQQYQSTKKEKQRMYAAYNLALGYEMQDSIATALEWAKKAQAAARKVDKITEEENPAPVLSPEGTPNYFLTSLYVGELQERYASLNRLDAQMNRFKDDF